MRTGQQAETKIDAVAAALFKGKTRAICEEMASTLRRSAVSPNIKDRRDYSCALFDQHGELVAQSAAIPVHLGSMAYAMRGLVASLHWVPDVVAFCNDPYQGGTHIPDITAIRPVYDGEILVGFVANRAHHADVGCEDGGCLPISTSLDQEGLRIPPTLVPGTDLSMVQQWANITGNPEEAIADFNAQIAACSTGERRLSDLIKDYGLDAYRQSCARQNTYAQTLVKNAISSWPIGEYSASDCLEGDGIDTNDIWIRLKLTIHKDSLQMDFTQTDDQCQGNLNAPPPVTAAAASYVIRSLLPADAPECAGMMVPVTIHLRSGSLLDPVFPAAVTAGNVETSQRIVDVMLQALVQVIPSRIPAMSQGTMNNVGFSALRKKGAFSHYETLGGGMGAHAQAHGSHGLQCHMTNTANTPAEVIEHYGPLRIRRYAIRKASGGKGKYQGGNGLVREYEFLEPMQVSLIADRRRVGPQGVEGGCDGLPGSDTLNDVNIDSKIRIDAEPLQRLCIKTPGGGGYGTGKPD